MMRKNVVTIDGGSVVKKRLADRRLVYLCVLALLLVVSLPLGARAQGSIYGTVLNSDLSTPANGDISFFGYLDDTDEEIRIETSTGAGFDAGNWYDEFQNYLTEAPGNPYDHYFYNVATGQGYHLFGPIPNNSFQQENILLAPASWPGQPTGVGGAALSSSAVVLSWDYTTGITYHVYRRFASSAGSFFRIDDISGALSNAGVADSFLVDNTVDGVSSYEYLLIAEDGSGNYSQHSAPVVVNSSVLAGPVVASIDPTNGLSLGGTFVNVYGSGFDMAGADVVVGIASLTGLTVVSPYHITGTTQTGPGGPADVTVTNTASAMANTLVGGYTYAVNTEPVLATIGAQNVTEGQPLSFLATATDVDLGSPVMTSTTLPPGATYLDNGDGTASFDWAPTFFDAGIYNVTFYATDDVTPSLVDSELVVITVDEAGNQLPLLTGIGPQTATEDVLLTVNVSATDVESTPTLTTSALPTGANFVDNTDGTGTFTWTPDFTQGGTGYDVTFFATDDSSAVASELVTITVNDAGNQLPVLAVIGGQATDENINLNFGVTASDDDSVIPLLSTSTLPAGALFTDNFDGTGVFDWTPTYDDSGTYAITVYATDGAIPSAIDSEIVSVVVTNVNRDLVLTAIGPQALTENVPHNIVISATDPDGDFAAFSSTTLPGAATLVDNLDGTATFDWTPSFADSGSYAITFYAADGAFPSVIDSETVAITVANTNRLPILTTIGAQAGTEEILLSFGVSAVDDDGDVPLLSISTPPTGVVFTDNFDGTASFDWTPTLAQSGTHLVTFYATDAAYPSDVDSEVVSINVGNVNQPPVLTAIGAQGAVEGILLSIPVTASDPDGTFPVLTTSLPPTGAILTDNGDGTGSFDWTPDFLQAGVHNVTFYASDGEHVDSEIVVITCVEAGNQIPAIVVIPPQTVTEGAPLEFVMNAVDPDGTIPTLSTEPLPDGASFVDNLDGTGSFSWTPDYSQSGSYDIMFYATDGVETDSQLVNFTVDEAGNQPPELAAIGAQGTIENILLSLVVTATDPDSTFPTFSTSLLPTGAGLVDNGDGTANFDWLPDFVQAGSYDITFYAADGEFIDSELVNFVIADNQSPVLDPIGDRTIAEGLPVSIPISGSDPDGTIPTFGSTVLPTGALLTDNGDGTAVFDWTPDFTQGGGHAISFYAGDGELADSELVTITVTEAGDQSPVIVAIPDTSVNEGETLIIDASASDPEGGPVALTISTNIEHYTFADNGDGTGQFVYSPDFHDSGEDTVIVFATEIGGTGLASFEVFVITTIEINQPPVFDPVGPFSMLIFDTLEVLVAALDLTDPDPEAVVFLPTDGLPANSTFLDNGDNTGTFRFLPVWGQDSVYNVTFWAVDQGTPALSSSMTVTITVQDANLPPIIDPLGPQAVPEGGALVITATGSDPDGVVPPVMLVDTVFENATFVDNGDGTATYDFAPSFVQSGLYNLTFGATDGIDTTWGDPVLVQVVEAGNQVPIFDPFPVDSVTEGQTTEGFVSGADPDLTLVTFGIVESSQPENFTFVDSGNGVAGFFFAPSYRQSGLLNVELIISDGELADTSVMVIYVNEAGNQWPVLDTILDYVAIEDELLQFTVTASDIDGPPPILSTSILPGAATFDGGSGLFDWTPSYDDSGTYAVTFYAADAEDPAAIDSQAVEIMVEDFNRTPWYFFPPMQRDTVEEGGLMEYIIVGWDDDGTMPEIVAFLDATDSLATNMTFSQEVVGTDQIGTLTFQPDFHQGDNGPTFYFVRFQVVDEADPSLYRESGTVTFRVYDENQPPSIVFSGGPGPHEIEEGANISFDVQGVDDDGDAVTLRAENLPDSNWAINQPTDDVIVFSFSPDYRQAGVYNISFIAEDEHMAADTQIVEITVDETGNHIPIFVSEFPDTVNVYATITYNAQIVALDPEGLPLILEATSVPANATWDTTGGVGSFVFNSQADQIGQVFSVEFTATDEQSAVATLTVNFEVNNFLRGDTDENDKYTVNDVIFLAGYMFRGGSMPSPLEAGDVDNSGQVDIADMTYLINYMYHAGPRPPQ
jgi:hypothetical protein